MRPCTASTTCGSSSVVGTEPVWPPPSPPCTITASTPHAAHLLGVALGADRRHDERRRRPSAASISCLASAPGRSSRPSRPRRSSSSMRSSTSAASARRFTPNGLVGARLHLGDRAAQLVEVIVALARMPSPPALAVAREPGAPGDPAHAGLHDRVRRRRTRSQSGCAARRASAGHLLVARGRSGR